jgi:uncharacterized protein
MRIFVDSDACPVKEEILDAAREKGIEVIFVVSTAGYSNRDWGVTQILVDKLPQAVDIAIINRMEAGDIVVTQDYGLALLVLGKKGQAISPRGMRFHDQNIDRLLLQRQMNYDARKAGMRVKGPKKLSAQDRTRFQDTFRSLLATV